MLKNFVLLYQLKIWDMVFCVLVKRESVKSGNSKIKEDGISIFQTVLVRMGFSSTSCACAGNLCSRMCPNH